jgi:hypothetical protein
VSNALTQAEAIVLLADLHRKTKLIARSALLVSVSESTLMQVLQRDQGQLQRMLNRET